MARNKVALPFTDILQAEWEEHIIQMTENPSERNVL
jgi:hypothetical protein